MDFSKIPSQICEFLDFLESKNIRAVIVGGWVRDFLRKELSSTDIDIELNCSPIILKDEIEKKYNCKIELLGYEIIRFQVDKFEFELSPPRKDIYQKQMIYGHKDFSAHISYTFSFDESFLRRDFRLNAIGIIQSKKKFSLVDPYKGFEDIQNQKLTTMNPDFFKDPVRFLRGLRFKTNWKYELEDSLLDGFNLEKLTSHYFCLEFFKSKNKTSYLRELFKYKKKVRHLIQEDEILCLQQLCHEFEISNEEDLLISAIILQRIASLPDIFPGLRKKEKLILAIGETEKLNLKKMTSNDLKTVKVLINFMNSSAFEKYKLKEKQKTLDKLSLLKKVESIQLFPDQKAQIMLLEPIERALISWNYKLENLSNMEEKNS